MTVKDAPYTVFATDYDGTIAHDGRVDEPTVAGLLRVREMGLALVLVTGRELPDLFNTFAHVSIFDLVVAENGGVLFTPESEALDVLGEAPPPALVEWLARRSIPVSTGHSIVATISAHGKDARQAIHDLGLPWQVICNKGSVMVLPEGVNKATGLRAALERLGAEPSRTIGVGDAENDEPFLKSCGQAVAVANALDSVKAIAHVVTKGARGDGVVEYIDHHLAALRSSS